MQGFQTTKPTIEDLTTTIKKKKLSQQSTITYNYSMHSLVNKYLFYGYQNFTQNNTANELCAGHSSYKLLFGKLTLR